MTPARARQLSQIRASLTRLARYDDESVVHEAWIRQRYTRGYAASYQPAREAAVRTAWHEAGHAVAALAAGLRFSSASIRQGPGSQGRVRAIAGGGGRDGFVIDVAGPLAEMLRDWSAPGADAALERWLAGWRDGDARRFRAAAFPRHDEVAAFRYAQRLLTPHRPQIRHIARALLACPRYLPYDVLTALYQDANPVSASSTTSAPARRRSAGG